DELLARRRRHEAAHERVPPEHEQQPPDLRLEQDDHGQDEHLADRAEERSQRDQVGRAHEHVHDVDPEQQQRHLHRHRPADHAVELVDEERDDEDVEEVLPSERDEAYLEGDAHRTASVSARSAIVAVSTRRNSAVAPTSCVRTMAAPPSTAAAVAPSVPNNRSSTCAGAFAEPSTAPIVLLREMPTSTGRPRPRNASVWARRRRFSRAVFPNPKPGSTTTSRTPAASAFATAAASEAFTSRTTSR